ncbi:hypothetical protein T265_11467 [Opisthorchis viverrini]|uniref:Death domain-containing protein n=1 Tax=Opisthorchis viverrini TaxID=6198 RepID=A0A074Z9D8_OPIVI|nr:hypothetical protein T265_11467 [Opisthorchis viverrini]KER19865.1 hypothetical protein T265_11467 [Opisthorchis viverrini]
MSIIDIENQGGEELLEKGSNKENLDAKVSTEFLDSAKDSLENAEQQSEGSGQTNVEDKPETMLTTAPNTPPVSIQSVTDTVMEKLPNLEDLCLGNLDEHLQRFRETFERALSMSESYAKDYTEKALSMESALNALAAYNKKALEQLGKLTLDAVKSKESSNTPADEAELKLGEAYVEKAKLLVETAGKQLEYSKQLGAITRPLMSWRLDASRAVWEAQSALKIAEKQYDEIKQRAQLRRPTQSQIPRTATESKQEESYQRTPQKEPVLDTGKSAEPESTLQTQQPLLDRSQKPERVSRPIEQERQPIKFWPKHVYTDKHGEEICYIRAPSDCLVKEEEIECRFSEADAPWPKIAGHSEFIGPLVSVLPLGDTENIIWSDEPWIIGVPNKHIKATSKESVIYAIESGPNGVCALDLDPMKVPTKDLVSWVERHTTEVVSDGKHYLECRMHRLSPITLAPCARIRRDSAEIGPLGGRLISVTEPKVALEIPESAVKVSLPFTLQVRQMDYRQLSFVKAQNELLMKEFLTCSPLVYLTSPRKTTFKPVRISFPIPEQTPPQRSNVDPSILHRVRYEHHRDVSMISDDGTGSIGQKKEVSAIVIMQNSEKTGDNWTMCEDAELVDTVDGVVTFSLQKIESCRLVAIKQLVGEMDRWLKCEFTGRKVRGSNPTSTSRFSLSRREKPGGIPALVLPSGGMTIKHQKGATAEYWYRSLDTVLAWRQSPYRVSYPSLTARHTRVMTYQEPANSSAVPDYSSAHPKTIALWILKFSLAWRQSPYRVSYPSLTARHTRVMTYQEPANSSAVPDYSSAHPKTVYACIVSAKWTGITEHGGALNLTGIGPNTKRSGWEQQSSYTKHGHLDSVENSVLEEKTLRFNLVQLNDRLPIDTTRDYAYKRKFYIGQASRKLHSRIDEHKPCINRPSGNKHEYLVIVNDSAMAGRTLDVEHRIDMENVDILRRGLRFTSQRLVAEVMEIANYPSVNRVEGVELANLSRMIDSETLSYCATLIEEGLSKCLVRIALLQNLKCPHQLCLISGQDQLDTDIKALNEEAYHEVEKPYGPVLLKEGQKLDIFIRPNLRLVGNKETSSQKKLTMKISLASISPNLHKLSRMIDSETLSYCATLIEEGLSKCLVRIALLQNLKCPHQLCLISGQDQLDTDIKALNEEAYHEVEKPYGPVLLKEGQKLDIFIRPNLRLVGNKETSSQKKLTMKISLASISPNLHKFVVEAIDQSAQVGFDRHQGVVDIYCEKDVCIPVIPERNKLVRMQSGPLTINTPSKTKKHRYQIVQEPVRLVRFVVSLPKVLITNPTPWIQSEFNFKPKDVVTRSYLKDLAKKLPGDSWQRLGSALDMSRGRLQVITAKFGEAEELLALAMLTSWIKTLPISADRFAILYRALQVIGRFDLAAELYSAGCSVNEDPDSVESSPQKSAG